MKLITETIEDIEVLTEANTKGGKDYKIKGVFMQADIKNRNGRVYPVATLSKEVSRYTTEYINKRRAFGELGHPDGPTVNLERVSHLIENLATDGNDVIGRAKILETPYGKVVKSLMDEGVKLGVSSRGMGTLKQKGDYNEVQEDFMLAAVDIVADPSAPDAFVNGIMEGKEWVWSNGLLREQEVAELQKELQRVRTISRNELNEAAVLAFEKFMSKL